MIKIEIKLYKFSELKLMYQIQIVDKYIESMSTSIHPILAHEVLSLISRKESYTFDGIVIKL